MNYPQLKYRDLIVVLIFEIKTLQRIFNNESKYSGLIKELSKYDINEGSLPTQKELLKSTNMTRTKLKSLMDDLHEDFHTKICNAKGYPVVSTEVWFLAKSIEEYWVVGLDGLEYLPRVGDNITLQFLRDSNYGGKYFYVEDIHHDIENGIHRIDISLSMGFNELD